MPAPKTLPRTKEGVDERQSKPKKVSGPDMGTYDLSKEFDFKEPGKNSQKWAPPAKGTIYDPIYKHSKGVPAPSHYKITPDHFARLSRSPPSIRVMRH